MDCQKAQELILDSLADARPGATTPELEIHLSVCRTCRSFSETQFMLDHQLSAAITAPALSPAFRASLAKRVRREPVLVWPRILAGCGSPYWLRLCDCPMLVHFAFSRWFGDSGWPGLHAGDLFRSNSTSRLSGGMGGRWTVRVPSVREHESSYRAFPQSLPVKSPAF